MAEIDLYEEVMRTANEIKKLNAIERTREWRKNNKEKYLAYNKKWRQEHGKEYFRNYKRKSKNK